MINIHKKTLQDLEFFTVLEHLSDLCVTSMGKTKAKEILPYTKKETLLFSLQLTNEYVSSFYNDNRIPNHGFDPITKELQLLHIENTFLETHSLKKLVSISLTVNDLLKFFNNFEKSFFNLSGWTLPNLKFVPIWSIFNGNIGSTTTQEPCSLNFQFTMLRYIQF